VSPNNPGISLKTFFLSFKKGSKKLRGILSGNSVGTLQEIKNSFCAVSNIEPVLIDGFEKSLEHWNRNSVYNRQREFIFKFYHNRLGLNSRVSHFIEVSKWCTFCSIVGRNLGPFSDETFTHLFFECPVVEKIHNDISTTLISDTPLNKQSWLGLNSGNSFLSLFLLLIQFYIWEAKLSQRLPDKNYCLGETIYTLSDAMKSDKQLRKSFENLNCPLSRLWARLTQPRW
jgi:hypothetical protein